ncbi:hypothetical protein BDA99DRAFT_590334, partial [Phascolomyces articulosus]
MARSKRSRQGAENDNIYKRSKTGTDDKAKQSTNNNPFQITPNENDQYEREKVYQLVKKPLVIYNLPEKKHKTKSKGEGTLTNVEQKIARFSIDADLSNNQYK